MQGKGQVIVAVQSQGPLNLSGAISRKAIEDGVLPDVLAGELAYAGVDEFDIRRLRESTERVMGDFTRALDSFGSSETLTWNTTLSRSRLVRAQFVAREYGKTVPEMLALGAAYALQNMQVAAPKKAAKALRLMAEHHSTGLWVPRAVDDGEVEASVGEVSPEDFSLSEELKARLLAWCQSYERDIDHTSDDLEQYRAFSAEGLAIAKAIKAELPDTQVTYWDELRFAQGVPRSERVYEVTLD